MTRKTTKMAPQVGIGRLLRTASTTFNRVFRMQLSPLGITYGQFQYLQGLWAADGLSQADLTRKVGVEMASSTAILNSLEDHKLIRRVRNRTDRRKIHVYLTAEAAALNNDLMACAVTTNAIARRGISNNEILALFDILARLIDNMNAQIDRAEALQPRKTTAQLRRSHSAAPKLVKPPAMLKT